MQKKHGQIISRNFIQIEAKLAQRYGEKRTNLFACRKPSQYNFYTRMSFVFLIWPNMFAQRRFWNYEWGLNWSGIFISKLFARDVKWKLKLVFTGLRTCPNTVYLRCHRLKHFTFQSCPWFALPLRIEGCIIKTWKAFFVAFTTLTSTYI